VKLNLARAGRRVARTGAVGLVVPLLLLALWEALSFFGVAPPNRLPPPLSVLWALYELADHGHLSTHVAVTLRRVAEGFVLGTGVATVLGALTGSVPLWRRLLDPTFQALRTIPSIAWVPLFVLWLGILEAPKVTLIALGAFFPVYLSTMAGIQQVDRKLVEVARIHGYGGIALVRRCCCRRCCPPISSDCAAGSASPGCSSSPRSFWERKTGWAGC
jgi:sulfonate transport system permease protein